MVARKYLDATAGKCIRVLLLCQTPPRHLSENSIFFFVRAVHRCKSRAHLGCIVCAVNSRRLPYGQYIETSINIDNVLMINGKLLRKYGSHATDVEYDRQYRLYAYNVTPSERQRDWHLLCVVSKDLRDRFVANGLEDHIFPTEGSAIELRFNATQAVGGVKKVKVVSSLTNASAKNPFGTAALLTVQGQLIKPYLYYESNEANFQTMTINLLP